MCFLLSIVQQRQILQLNQFITDETDNWAEALENVSSPLQQVCMIVRQLYWIEKLYYSKGSAGILNLDDGRMLIEQRTL